MIKEIYIENYKIFRTFTTQFNSSLNILVGDNEAGKSTILEAINLVLTRRLNGRFLEYELNPHIFNKNTTQEYIQALIDNTNPIPPKIIIDLFLEDNDLTKDFRGSNNYRKEDAVGIRLEIIFDDNYAQEYSKFIEDKIQIRAIPTEYYRIEWISFSGNSITARSIPLLVSFIDATTIKLQNGADYYLQNIINNGLDIKERVGLSILYRSLKEKFTSEESIKTINDKLSQDKGIISNKNLTVSIDISQKANWETNLVPHLDEIPFTQIGKGEQNAMKIMLALSHKADNASTVLIEEPENHLSFTSMNILVSKIKNKCTDKQIFITTHSAYVLNKLGIENVIFISNQKTTSLNQLTQDTYDYFRKLSGYDTLRLILAKKTILVEGPSDELIVNRAYFLAKGKLPIEDGIDVINVRGLSFARFLDIAKILGNNVSVVTDNDGDYDKKVVTKYQPYSQCSNINIYSSNNNGLYTMECHIVELNTLETLNSTFNKAFTCKDDLLKDMIDNKTEYALMIFDTTNSINLPDYINNAVNQE